MDDISHIKYLESNVGLPELICCRYNPGSLKGGNVIIGKPEEAKYGFTKDQLFDGYKILKDKGVKRFGLHTMVASNELEIPYFLDTAKMLFRLAADISKELNIIDVGNKEFNIVETEDYDGKKVKSVNDRFHKWMRKNNAGFQLTDLRHSYGYRCGKLNINTADILYQHGYLRIILSAIFIIESNNVIFPYIRTALYFYKFQWNFSWI